MKTIRELLGIEFPIIGGAMANITDGKFAAAISNAGGLGIIAGASLDGQSLREQIQIAKKLTDKPFGVNVMMMNPVVDEIAAVVAEEKVPVVTTGAGNPARFMESWKKSGSVVIPVIPASVLAKKMEAAGADAVIAEGTESGGHIGELTTMALIPQVVDAVNIPVIAAGGIASGRQMAAAFALGAVGVQIGTALLVSQECPVHENYKKALLDAVDTDTVVTGRIIGAPVRIIKNQMSREYLKHEKAGATLEELEKFTLGSLRKSVLEGDVELGSVMAGQVSGMLKEIRPARAILEDIYSSAKAVKIEL